jgi:hypothetical protein
VIHSDRGVQFTSWAFSRNVRDAGLAPSMRAVGSPYDNAMVESFWGRMQVELLNRRRRKTRIEPASAIDDYIELFHNTRRRTARPREQQERPKYETNHTTAHQPPDSRTTTPRNQGQITVSVKTGHSTVAVERDLAAQRVTEPNHTTIATAAPELAAPAV